MSPLLEKIEEHTVSTNPKRYSWIAIKILVTEIELLKERVFCLEHLDEIEAKERVVLSTAEQCREDNERI